MAAQIMIRKSIAATVNDDRQRSGGNTRLVTLAIDVGGTGIKMMSLDADGKPLTERFREPTPQPATPKALLQTLDQMKTTMREFDRVSVGFPGVIKDGKTLTAPNLNPGWIDFPLQKTLERMWRKPARVANDAAVQGYAAIRGQGVELMLTLGTGLGSALFTDGHLCPGLELGHHPWRKKTYGKKQWSKLLLLAVAQTAATFNWDTLYIGGGNNKDIKGPLGPNIKIISNEDGLLGGVALWKDQT
jgi:polyphosphate glucokinase